MSRNIIANPKRAEIGKILEYSIDLRISVFQLMIILPVPMPMHALLLLVPMLLPRDLLFPRQHCLQLILDAPILVARL